MAEREDVVARVERFLGDAPDALAFSRTVQDPTPWGTLGVSEEDSDVTAGDFRLLLSALREAREDGARLDWLERTIREQAGDAAGIFLGWEDEGREQFRLYVDASLDAATPEEAESLMGTHRVMTNEMCENGTGLREAIDAARRQGEDK